MIKINNKEYKFKLGFKALLMYQDETGKDLSSMGSDIKLMDIVELCYYGMVSQGETITKEYLIDAIDETPSLISTISDAMGEGMAAFNGLNKEAKK
tara:strand:- start:2958 stop:3245 length:288 start_codon:yes stop_codon:yes gene_type:complete